MKQQESDGDLTCVIPCTLVHLSFPLALEVQLGAKLQKTMKKKKFFFDQSRPTA